jgi:hypothetical protein
MHLLAQASPFITSFGLLVFARSLSPINLSTHSLYALLFSRLDPSISFLAYSNPVHLQTELQSIAREVPCKEAYGKPQPLGPTILFAWLVCCARSAFSAGGCEMVLFEEGRLAASGE